MLFSMKAIKLFVFATVLLCAIFSFSSCSRLMGYSVVLWSLPEQNLTDGMIVPVYTLQGQSLAAHQGRPAVGRAAAVAAPACGNVSVT